MLASMKHFPCMCCGIEDGTIVGAHSNSSSHGKGRGIKAHDIVAALCHKCHQDFDVNGVATVDDFLEAVYKTMVYGFNNGIFMIAK